MNINPSENVFSTKGHSSRAALSNSYSNALRAVQGGSLYHFYDDLWYDSVGTKPTSERRTHLRVPLRQPDTETNVEKHGLCKLQGVKLYLLKPSLKLSLSIWIVGVVSAWYGNQLPLNSLREWWTWSLSYMQGCYIQYQLRWHLKKTLDK